jgi:HEPN domain-containing protein
VLRQRLRALFAIECVAIEVLILIFRFDAAAYHQAIYVLTEAISLVRHGSTQFPALAIGKEPADNMIAQLIALEQALGSVDVSVTKIAIQEFKDKLQHQAQHPVSFYQTEKALVGISDTLRRELTAEHIFVLSATKATYYKPETPLFGTAVEDAFPLSKEDIEEAGKCLALGRSTAAVFHLSRAMEAAVQALSQKLGMTNLNREWGKLLSEMKGKIEVLPAGDLKNRWSENHSLLYHVKQAWRNDVMHPKATYTDEQALEVFQAMRSFMRNLVPLID